jgi:D-mannonate dehydratase
LQRGAELFEEALDSVLLDVTERLAIHSSDAAIPFHSIPRLLKDVTPPDVIVKGVESPTRCPLGCDP